MNLICGNMFSTTMEGYIVKLASQAQGILQGLGKQIASHIV